MDFEPLVLMGMILVGMSMARISFIGAVMAWNALR